MLFVRARLFFSLFPIADDVVSTQCVIVGTNGLIVLVGLSSGGAVITGATVGRYARVLLTLRLIVTVSRSCHLLFNEARDKGVDYVRLLILCGLRERMENPRFYRILYVFTVREKGIKSSIEI